MSQPSPTEGASPLDVPVLGMTCAACVRRVEKAALAVPGVTSVDVNLALSRARLVFDRSAEGAQDTPARAVAAVAAIAAIAAIRAAGYEVPADVLDPHTSGGARLAAIEQATREDTAGLQRDAILAIVLAGPLLVIAMAHGVIEGTASVIVQMLLGTAVVIGPGRRYLRGGWIAVRHGSPDMNTLIALGAGAAWLSSLVTAARWLAGPRHHMPPLYFEAGAAIIAFVMIGKLLEARARSRLAEAVRGLLSLAPATARTLVGDVETTVEAGALAAGDVVVIRPGERMPADGTVIEGTSAADESMLTGEAMPVDKTEGSPVYAGALNHHGALTVRVARAGVDTALARIARAVEEAQGGKAPIARLADRVAAYFVPAVLAIAALTFGVWVIVGAGTGVALERMIAVLVIACPCALGLATPAAVAVGTARGAELGILFRSAGALEVGSTIDLVCLDKTGTLTAGTPTLVALTVTTADGMAGLDEAALLRLVASAEQGSEHPVARAIVAAAVARGLALVRPQAVTAEPGAGLTAQVLGHAIVIGTRDLLVGRRIPVPTGGAPLPAGASISEVAIDGVHAGRFAIADPPAPTAAAAVAALRALGVETVMITGDRAEPAAEVARAVGIERVHAGISPTGKAALVRELRTGPRRVAMVGDGINDAPALAAADLGVALGSGTDIAAAAADVTLLRGGISALPTALGLARATLHTIRRNLVAAFAYNLVCIPIAAGALSPWTGWQLSPVLASAAMSLSSVSVLLSSLRLRSWAPPN